MELKSPEQMRLEFIEIVTPVIKWMAENQHPHARLIIDSTNAELVEGKFNFHTAENVND